VQILVDIAIADIFPEHCDKWRATNQDIRARYIQELTKRKDTVREEIVREEDSLRRVLREAVVEDVVKLFPYVLFGCRQVVRY
jgi:F0F1-type ATP synthase membrane subunit b/b'